ncbi:hypothetical protein [Nocardia noduli]|nr:hypothetical protein [Nocardia noduli]
MTELNCAALMISSASTATTTPADTIARPRVCGGTTQVFLHGLAEA